MRVTLIYPPIGDPRAPQLALPSLAAALRRQGITVDMLDLNVSGIHSLLDAEALSVAARRLRDRVGRRPDPNDPHGRLALMADHIVEHAPAALRTLRDRQLFYDANEYNTARDFLFAGLAMSAAAADAALDVGLVPIRYDVGGKDPRRLDHLIAVTGDQRSNLFAEYWEQELVPRLAHDAPDLVGVTITNRQQIVPGLTLARMLRARGHYVVLGGAVYTKFVDQLATRPEFFNHFADAVIVYEGETPLLGLLHALSVGDDLDSVPNLLYERDGSVRVTRAHVEDVRELPTPDFEGLPLDRYLSPETVLPILTGKGCYYNRCRFCDIPFINHISRRSYRVLPPERVVEDANSLWERFGCRHFLITDEALSPKLLSKLAEAFDEGGRARYSFTGYARLEAGFTEEVFAKLTRMGMRKIFFGLESGSQETQDHMDKGIDVATSASVLRRCREAGIAFHLFSIIGFPEEDEASARQTYRFFMLNQAAIDHPANSFDVHPFGLELRTSYFEERAAVGIELTPDALDADFAIGLRRTEWDNTRGLSPREVDRLLAEFDSSLGQRFRSYHNTPLHLWPGFEEYSMLYASHYEDRPFPFRTTLPAADGERRVRLRWNPAHHRMVLDGKTRFIGLHGWTEVDSVSDELVSGSTLAGEGSGDEARSGPASAFRARSDNWFRAGLLQLSLPPS